jgi:hypothetical protein
MADSHSDHSRDYAEDYSALLRRLPPQAWMAADKRKTIRVLAARDALHEAERVRAAAATELRTAVRASVAAGDSWRTVGVILGVSRQVAQRRFGPMPDESEWTYLKGRRD